MSAERFAGYRCTFMHMMPAAMTDWLTFRAHGTTRAGRDAPDKSGEPCDLDAEIGWLAKQRMAATRYIHHDSKVPAHSLD